MTQPFTLDAALEAVTAALGAFQLCEVRLMRDARYPWLVLIPQRTGLVEIDDLSAVDRAVMMEEAVRAGEIVRAIGAALGRPVDKLNIAALGNVTPQLHLHVVGRRRDDAAWPGPVWGVGEAAPYSEDEMAPIRALWNKRA